jgi:hypothetical protein
VNIQYLLASGTLDEVIWRTLEKKLDVARASLDRDRGAASAASPRDEPTDEEARLLFAELRGGAGAASGRREPDASPPTKRRRPMQFADDDDDGERTAPKRNLATELIDLCDDDEEPRPAAASQPHRSSLGTGMSAEDAIELGDSD